MKIKLIALLYLLNGVIAYSQNNNNTTQNIEIKLERDSLRIFFGTYEFAPQFKMNIFSLNDKIFAQRIGDQDKFQIFSKSKNVFFLKAMPAELEFVKSSKGSYDTLLLHQEGKDLKANRISSQPFELYDTILHVDSLLYDAYNRRDFKSFIAFFSTDLEFYHDLTGKTDYKQNFERFKTNFAKPNLMRRELLKGSLEVYQINGYGAIQYGTHNFYQTNPGEAEKLVAQPKFMHIWKRIGNNWKIVRIVSYDH